VTDGERHPTEVETGLLAEAVFLKDDPDDPSRKLIRQVLGAVAEYERSMIALRLKAGRRRKHEKGGYAYRSPAYGYKAEGKELTPDADEQAALDRIRQLYADGQSFREIAATLTAEGYRPTPLRTETGGPVRPSGCPVEQPSQAWPIVCSGVSRGGQRAGGVMSTTAPKSEKPVSPVRRRVDVVILIALLVGVGAFLLAQRHKTSSTQQHRNACKSDANSVESAVESFRANSQNGAYPSDLASLTRPDANGTVYLRAVPTSKHYTITLANGGVVLVNGQNVDTGFNAANDPCDSVR
jgi:Resolvase, N terminal domain